MPRGAPFLTGEEFETWRKSRQLTQAEIASWLGITHQAVSQCEARGVSRVMALALAAIDAGFQPYKPTEEDIEQSNLYRKGANYARIDS